MYQGFIITFASLAPVAAITYSLLYGISTKKKVIMIDTKRSHGEQRAKPRSYSIGSLDDYADLLEGEDEFEDPGYFGNLKLAKKKNDEENYLLQEATKSIMNENKESGHQAQSGTSDSSLLNKYLKY